tara:strand:- start:4831 stop:4953 length:123 start_codon:yes stop_codon:yes gene_type:complete
MKNIFGAYYIVEISECSPLSDDDIHVHSRWYYINTKGYLA